MELEINETSERPDLGILTMPDKSGRSFRGNRDNFLDLLRAGRQLGANVCVISQRDLRPSYRRILCYTYDEEKKDWVSRLMPLPRVIYNRIPYRKDEMRPEVQATISSVLRHSQLQLFNPTFFNKWTLFEWLGKAQTTRKYIPVTKLLSNPAELELLLKQYPVLYLKPVRGKAGSGIMKIERIRSKDPQKFEYWLSMQENKSSLTSKYASLAPVWRKIREVVDEEEYIAQQGILLTSYRKRPFDLRVLVQKNGKGVWGVSGIGARVAGKQSITTHVPRGGSIDDPEKLLSHSFGPEKAKQLMIQVKKASLLIASQIEKKSGYALGEMSMDLGIDTLGAIWFFEANSKPMKFDEPHIRKRSLERIVQYTQYLIGKKNRFKPGAAKAGSAGSTGLAGPAGLRKPETSKPFEGGLAPLVAAPEQSSVWSDNSDLPPKNTVPGARLSRPTRVGKKTSVARSRRGPGLKPRSRRLASIRVTPGGITHVRTTD